MSLPPIILKALTSALFLYKDTLGGGTDECGLQLFDGLLITVGLFEIGLDTVGRTLVDLLEVFPLLPPTDCILAVVDGIEAFKMGLFRAEVFPEMDIFEFVEPVSRGRPEVLVDRLESCLLPGIFELLYPLVRDEELKSVKLLQR